MKVKPQTDLIAQSMGSENPLVEKTTTAPRNFQSKASRETYGSL